VTWRDSRGRARTGQCTRFLDALAPGDAVVVSVKPSVMKLPPLDAQPVIMAGLGTGMAPFRAFIEERAVRQREGAVVGPMTLYFGSRHRAMEYLYGEELEAYHAAGLLTNLRLAFSRDQRDKVYIQHCMRQDAALLADHMLAADGAFYLCGPTWPAGDVKDAMVAAFTGAGGVRPADANKVIEDLKERERYILEVPVTPRKSRHPNRPPCVTPCKTLYVRNLNEKKPPRILASALRALFETYGTVVDVRVRHSLRMRGQAFVVFADQDHATAALAEVQGFVL
ncbi:sulfite reductase [NADPH] flavoprotein component, partial [Coemansia sp. RSA 2603]